MSVELGRLSLLEVEREMLDQFHSGKVYRQTPVARFIAASNTRETAADVSAKSKVLKTTR